MTRPKPETKRCPACGVALRIEGRFHPWCAPCGKIHELRRVDESGAHHHPFAPDWHESPVRTWHVLAVIVLTAALCLLYGALVPL